MHHVTNMCSMCLHFKVAKTGFKFSNHSENCSMSSVSYMFIIGTLLGWHRAAIGPSQGHLNDMIYIKWTSLVSLLNHQ